MSPGERNGERRKQGLFSPFTEIVREEFDRAVHVSALHYLAGLVLVVLFVEATTGLLLMVYYRPWIEAAHTSVATITDEVRLGWLVRGLHARGADFLILLCALYLIGLFALRSYQRPRHLAWAAALVFLLVVLAFAMTGTLLPWDQYGYWSMEWTHHAVASVPVLGAPMIVFFWGGPNVGQDTLLRFHALHVAALPIVAIGVLAIHLLVVRRFGLAEAYTSRAPVSVFPDFLLSFVIAVLLTAGVVLSATVLFPPSLLEPADVLVPPSRVGAPWYLMPEHRLLQAVSEVHGVFLLVGIALLLLLLPLLDPGPTATRRGKLFRWGLALVVGGGALVLGTAEYFS